LRALGREPVDIDCGAELRYRLTPQRVEAIDDPLHGLVLMSPGNPTGAMLEHAELAAVAAVCRRRGTRLISDEIYHGISYGRVAATALAIDPDAIVVNSFSKLYRLSGWRLGWLVAPIELVPALSSYLVNFFLTPPALSQHAALAAFDDLPNLHAAVAMYARNRAMLLAALPGLGLKSVQPPDGAFYLYLDVGHLTDDSLEFCGRLLEDTGVALAPGIDFDPQFGHSHVRLSFAVTTAQVERALELLAPWLARQRTR
jgi:aspartate/methionine/tyrosine aminotransferase